jgi:LysM repeat protein
VTRPYQLGIGETAISVARQYGLSVEEIQAANPGMNINRLKAGETIRVPNAQPAP